MGAVSDCLRLRLAWFPLAAPALRLQCACSGLVSSIRQAVRIELDGSARSVMWPTSSDQGPRGPS
jgi:hypothetical protein